MRVVGRFVTRRSVCLLRENTRLRVHNPGLPEESAGEKFEIESDLSDKLLWYGTIQVDRDDHRTAFSLDRYGVVERQIGVDHRVESRQMPRGIGKTQTGRDGVGYRIQLPFSLFRDRLPLAGCRFEANISISGYPVSMHDQGNTTLMALRINVVEAHYIHTLVLEITFRS